MINAGTWLTTTRSSGSGSTIPARYFMDGWGLIEGDVIQFQGQTNTYKVIDVNYSGRSITIQGSASWAQGVGISLPCKGSRPDMGAFEYDEKPAPVDGDQDTRWAVKPLDSSIEVDLGAVYTINAAEVLSYAGRGYQFTISVSTDGSTFTQVVDESDTTEPDITRSEFSAIEARYVRLNLTGAYNYTNNFSGITEFWIFGYTVPVSTV